jgi:hypothetical protein
MPFQAAEQAQRVLPQERYCNDGSGIEMEAKCRKGIERYCTQYAHTMPWGRLGPARRWKIIPGNTGRLVLSLENGNGEGVDLLNTSEAGGEIRNVGLG